MSEFMSKEEAEAELEEIREKYLTRAKDLRGWIKLCESKGDQPPPPEAEAVA